MDTSATCCKQRKTRMSNGEEKHADWPSFASVLHPGSWSFNMVHVTGKKTRCFPGKSQGDSEVFGRTIKKFRWSISLNFRGDFSWFLLQVDRDVGLPKHFHPFPKYEWVKSLLPCLCMSMCSYNHCHGVCSCETHTLSSCIRTAVGRSSSNKTWIPWTRWWNHVVCPLSCECLGACFSLFLFWGEGKDEWKQHGWQGFLSRTLAWPSCAIDIDWLYHVWRGLFHGVSFFLGLRIINSFRNRMLRPTARPSGQNAEIHARMRGRQKPSSTGASGATRVFQHAIFCCADMKNALMQQKKRHRRWLDMLEKILDPTHWSKLRIFWDGDFFGNRSIKLVWGYYTHQNTKNEWIMTDWSFSGRHATNLWTWNYWGESSAEYHLPGLTERSCTQPLVLKIFLRVQGWGSPLKRVASFTKGFLNWHHLGPLILTWPMAKL